MRLAHTCIHACRILRIDIDNDITIPRTCLTQTGAGIRVRGEGEQVPKEEEHYVLQSMEEVRSRTAEFEAEQIVHMRDFQEARSRFSYIPPSLRDAPIETIIFCDILN